MGSDDDMVNYLINCLTFVVRTYIGCESRRNKCALVKCSVLKSLNKIGLLLFIILKEEAASFVPLRHAEPVRNLSMNL